MSIEMQSKSADVFSNLELTGICVQGGFGCEW